MGRVIVTKTKVLKEPYQMKESGQLLYSYEELCYYIDTRMPLWLMEEERVGMTAWLSCCGVVTEYVDEMSPYEAAAKILSAGSYFKSDEKRQLLDRMKKYDRMPLSYKEKEKGDLYLSYGKMQNAYFAYEKASFSITGEEDSQWLTALYHNMGILCCRFFYWEEAKKWLLKAMEKMERPQSRIALDLVNDMLKKDWSMGGIPILPAELEKKKQEFVNEL